MSTSFWTEQLRKQAVGRIDRGREHIPNPHNLGRAVDFHLSVKGLDEIKSQLEKVAEAFITLSKAAKRATLKRRLLITEVPFLQSEDLVMSKQPDMVTGNIYRTIFSLEGLDLDEKVTLASNVALDFIHRKSI